MQIGGPVVPEVWPLVPGLGLPVRDCPAVQAMQPPLPSQTMPLPQAVPADRLPKSRQTGAPVWQLTMPVLHAVGLVEQFALGVQAAQVPLPSQTRFAPQVVPPGLLVPSTQVCAPVAHEVTPFLHALGLPVHGWP